MSPAPTARGTFITFEGGEGAGKSTQVRLLVEKLREAGINAIATREPGGSADAEILRDILLSGLVKPLGPKAEAILFSAARIDHVDKTIKPALEAGTWVVCDRFSDSTRAYQGATGTLDPRFLAALERVTLAGLAPDLTVVLDLPADIGLARAAARRGEGGRLDRFEAEDLHFHEALRQIYLDIAAAEPRRCLSVDATQPSEDVGHAVWDAVVYRLLSPPPLNEPAPANRPQDGNPKDGDSKDERHGG